MGAIPAMVFVGIFMMPHYFGSRARSVPEYLKLRFDEKTRTLNALSFAAMTIFSSGVAMYAMEDQLMSSSATSSRSTIWLGLDVHKESVTDPFVGAVRRCRSSVTFVGARAVGDRAVYSTRPTPIEIPIPGG